MSTKSPKINDLDADGFLLKLLLNPKTTKHQYDQVCFLFKELGFVEGDVTTNGSFMKLHEPMLTAKSVDCLCHLISDADENVITMHVIKEDTGESVWLIYSADWVGVPVVLANYTMQSDAQCCSNLDEEKRYNSHQIYTDSETFEVFEDIDPMDVVPIQSYQVVADFLADIMGEDVDWENWGDN